MLNKEIRSQTFSTAKQVQQWLYADGENGYLLYFIAEKYDLHHEEMYSKFAITVGDIVLGFYRVEDTVPLLQQELGLDPRTAALLGADVLDFLAPLSDPNWQPPEEARAEDSAVADTVYSQTNTTVRPDANTTHTNPDPQLTAGLDRQANLQYQSTEINPALHTMATDINSVRQVKTPEDTIPTPPTLNLEATPTYVTQSQDSLRQSLSDTPQYSPEPTSEVPNSNHDTEPPRWSTS